MKNATRKALPVLVLGSLAFMGCSEPADTTKTTTQTETKQVGSTVESTTKTNVQTPTGDAKQVTNSYVGTVTQFTPGKSIEVMTGDKDTHSFDLDGKDDVVSIDPKTSIGSKVQLVEEKADKGIRKVTVTIAPAV
jgi:hypothetical protein